MKKIFILFTSLFCVASVMAEDMQSIKTKYIEALYDSPNLLKHTETGYYGAEYYDYVPEYDYNNYNSYQQINSGIRFAVEYGIGLFGVSTVETKIEHIKTEQETTLLNNSGYLAIGLDLNGFQLGFAPRFQKIEDYSDTMVLQFAFDIPLLFDETQPFLEVGAQYANMELKDVDISDSSIGFFLGGGIKHYISENLFVKFLLIYNELKFDTDYEGYDIKVETSGFELSTAIGYRF